MSRSANRPIPGVSHPDSERGDRVHNGESGNAGRDGYSVVARRPRVAHVTESVSPDRAERIEGMYSSRPRGLGDY